MPLTSSLLSWQNTHRFWSLLQFCTSWQLTELDRAKRYWNLTTNYWGWASVHRVLTNTVFGLNLCPRQEYCMKDKMMALAWKHSRPPLTKTRSHALWKNTDRGVRIEPVQIAYYEGLALQHCIHSLLRLTSWQYYTVETFIATRSLT